MIDYTIYGGENIDKGSRTQMENACQLPVARKAALMPDAHLGYGLPIGGVLGAKDAILPYGVGMDIACRMRITITDADDTLGIPLLNGDNCRQLKAAVRNGTRFGMGNDYKPKNRPDHAVMDDPAWESTPLLEGLRAKAWNQLGTSGGGNHFVDWGILTTKVQIGDAPPGCYVALMSHSGSRGSGYKVCRHYTDIAKEQNPAGELSWLDMASEAGQEYWEAMNLMGRYASANHEVIHRKVLAEARLRSLGHVENHHNFAWKEIHDGEELIVHRKGATPAAKGELGVIPGSMGTPAYVVQGLGRPESLCSASHGAGRALSRKAAKNAFSWPEWDAYLEARGISLLQGGLDETPGAYKDITQVMESQRELVEPIGMFLPKIVLMAQRRRAVGEDHLNRTVGTR